MRYNTLGKTGLRVSALSFGAATLGEEYGAIDMQEARRSIDYAIDHGINYFDVAPYYGGSLAEQRLGEALVGKRDKVILATKVGRYKSSKGERFDFSARGIREALEQNLRRLQTDYIDVYQAHDIEYMPAVKILEEALPTLAELKQEGKIGFVGITSYPLNILKRIVEQADVDTVLSYSRYQLMDTSLDRVLAPTLRERNIGLINGSPLNMALLTHKGPPDWHPAPKSVLDKAREIAQWCEDRSVRIETLAMQFAMSYPAAHTTLVGMSKVDHVRRNLELLETPPDTELIEELRRKIEPVADICWQEGIPENHDPDSVLNKELEPLFKTAEFV
jgi:L-galactose dehydrogenase